LLTLKRVDDAHPGEQERDQHQCDDDRGPNPASLAPVAPPTVQEGGTKLALAKRVEF